MNKLYLLGLHILLVVLGALLYKDISVAKSDGLTQEQIYEIHEEYVESTYGSDAGFRITSYGESGVGYINHDTGEVIWNVTDMSGEK